jgi:hypothetical protein
LSLLNNAQSTGLNIENAIIQATISNNVTDLAILNRQKAEVADVIATARRVINEATAEAKVLNPRIKDLKAQIAATK